MLQDPALHYLDNAATTIPDPAVLRVVENALEKYWGNPSSLYAPGLLCAQKLENARSVLAQTLGCAASEVYFTACGSESNNLALLGTAHSRSWGSRIVVSGFEHPSVTLPLEQLAREGYDVRFVAPETDGSLDVDKMLALVDRNTILTACMAVNNETGAVVDVARLAAGVKARSPRCAVHVDAVQGFLRVPVGLENVDSLSISGHKLHAPKGIGALYLRTGHQQSIRPPYLGGGQERGIRPGTENLPYALGLAAAARSLAATLRERTASARALNDRLRAGLRELPGITLNSPENAVPQVLNFSTNAVKSQTMLNFLSDRQIYISGGSACHKGAASHTLLAMGRDPLSVDTALRVSFCGQNTPADVDALLAGLREGLDQLAHIQK